MPSDKPIKPPAKYAHNIQTEAGRAGKAKFPNVITMGVELKNENVMLATNTSIRKNPDRSWAILRIYSLPRQLTSLTSL